MTAFRLIPLPIHAALRVLSGLALMVLPFVLAFSATGAVLAVAIGAVVMGVSLRAVDTADARSLAPSDLHAFDYGTVVAVAASALALAALTDDDTAGLVLGLAAVVLLGGNLLTRYSARG